MSDFREGGHAKGNEVLPGWPGRILGSSRLGFRVFLSLLLVGYRNYLAKEKKTEKIKNDRCDLLYCMDRK